MPQSAIAILSGTLLAWYGNDLPDPLWTACLPLLLLTGAANPACRCLSLAAAAYLWSAAVFQHNLEYRLDESYDNRVTRLRGIVADLPVALPGRLRIELRDIEIDAYPGPLPRRIRLNWYRDAALPGPGEHWQFEVKLRQPRGLSNPAGFDYPAWLFAHRVDALGYIRNSPHNRRLAPAPRTDLDHWRSRLAVRIDAACADCEHIGLIKALALGYRGDIPRRQRELLQTSATSHLLAISGLHIGLAALLGFAAGRTCWRLGLYRSGIGRAGPSAAGAMLVAAGYAALAGFSLPTTRALVMLGVLLAALLLRRRADLLQSLALAVIVILIVDPAAVATGSFWLSVGAVLVIAFFRFRLPGSMPRWRRLLGLQLLFALLFAPPGLLLFAQFTPASLPANLFAIPLLSLCILPVVLLAAGFAAIGLPWTQFLLRFADLVLGLLLDVLETLLALGLSAIPAAYPATLLVGLLAASIWLALPRGLPLRPAAAMALLLLLTWQPPKPRQGDFELLIFDVGMGTSVLLQTRHHSLVYDFGPGRPGVFSAAESALLPALRARHIRRPDLAIVSHVDQDHSGGLYAMLAHFPDLALLSGTPRELATRYPLNHGAGSCHEYPPWRWDGVEFRFLTAAGAPASTNDRSCVLQVVGHHRALLPGDIEAGREVRLVAEYGAGLAAEILLAPHHGSESSSSRFFLARVAPRFAVFTMARGNRWGFPSAAIVERYRQFGIQLLRSDRDGAISFHSGPDGLQIKRSRAAPPRFWLRW